MVGAGAACLGHEDTWTTAPGWWSDFLLDSREVKQGGLGEMQPHLSARVDSPRKQRKNDDATSAAQGRTQEGILSHGIRKEVRRVIVSWACCRLPPGPHPWAPGSMQAGSPGRGEWSDRTCEPPSPRVGGAAVGTGCDERPPWGHEEHTLCGQGDRQLSPTKRGRSLRRVQKPPGLGNPPTLQERCWGGPPPQGSREEVPATGRAGWRSVTVQGHR